MSHSENFELLSREELLNGLPAKRASTVLFAIESHTSHLVMQAQQAAPIFFIEKDMEERNQAFLNALALGRDLPQPPTIQELERYAPQWVCLIPENSGVRAALAHLLGQKYRFRAQAVPNIRSALGLTEDMVRQVYQRLYHQPLDTIFVPQITLRDKLRWAWTAVDKTLEGLPPFWVAFLVSLPIGGVSLALPIAIADLGPLPALFLILVLGLINIVTVMALAEAVARNGAIRYGSAYFGRVVNDYLGNAGSFIFSLVLTAFSFGLLLVFYIGIPKTLEDSTGVQAEIWAAIMLLAGLYFIIRGSFNVTIGLSMFIQTVNIGLFVLLIILALPHIRLENLSYMNVPILNGRPFEPVLLQVVFGVVIGLFFSHTGVGFLAKLLLRRDPSARSLVSGHAAGLVFLILLNGLWIVAVNGSVAPHILANHTGTVLGPLVAQIGPGIQIVGSLFALLSMGIGSIFFSFSLFNLIRERLPLKESSIFGPGGRLILSSSPVVLVFLIAEWLLVTEGGSFAGLLGFLGIITSSLVAGIFPVLLLIASRRKGEYVPTVVYGFLGNPILLGAIYLFFLATLFLHGLVIWKNPLEQIGAVAGGILIVNASLVMLRQKMFRRRLVVELRQDQREHGQTCFTIIDSGKPAHVGVQLNYAGGKQAIQSAAGEVLNFSSLRSVSVQLPSTKARDLKVWAHTITPEGISKGIPAHLVVHGSNETHTCDLTSPDGQVVLPVTSDKCRIEIRLTERSQTQSGETMTMIE